MEGPLVEVAVHLMRRGSKSGGKEGGRKGEEGGEGEQGGKGWREPRDKYERLVWWMQSVGPERVPGIESPRKWRGIVRGMWEPGVRAARVRQNQEELDGCGRKERKEKRMDNGPLNSITVEHPLDRYSLELVDNISNLVQTLSYEAEWGRRRSSNLRVYVV